MIQYPQGLPSPQRPKYGFKPVSSMRRTQKMKGRARQRPVQRSTPTDISLTWKVNAVQSQLWQSWWDEVLVGGTAWFEMRLKTDQGMQLYKCRFTDDYEGPELEGVNRWIITAPLELYERPILRGGWAQYAPDYMLYMREIDIMCTQTWPEAPVE